MFSNLVAFTFLGRDVKVPKYERKGTTEFYTILKLTVTVIDDTFKMHSFTLASISGIYCSINHEFL